MRAHADLKFQISKFKLQKEEEVADGGWWGYKFGMSVGEKRLSTGEEYLKWEEDAFERSEFITDEIFAMSGASLAHNTISSNLNGEIRNGLKGRPCRVFSSDMKVRVDLADAYFYPDLVGLCGDFETHDRRDHICRNPQFIIEILSDSTEAYDSGKKFQLYQALVGDEAVLKLESVNCEVSFLEIFQGVKN